MHKSELYLELRDAISDIHNNIFPEIEVDEVLCKEDDNLNNALNKYVIYFNFTENTDKFNLDYCFKTTLKDLEEFYEYQENKLVKADNTGTVHELEHKVNKHIYDEVILCQKKVNRIYTANLFISYLLAFLLLLVINQITHLLEINTWLGSIFLASIMAFLKLLIDKNYLEKLRNKVGWESYKHAVKRSLTFYFASVVLQNQCNNAKINNLTEDEFMELKEKVRNSINILLSKIIL